MNPILISLLLATVVSGGPEIWPRPEDFAAAESEGITRIIDDSKDGPIQAHFEVTSKGNGTISLPGLHVRVYDGHDDGLTIRGDLLTCRWRDLDNDGHLDLEVEGIAIAIGDDPKAVPVESKVSGSFRWDAVSKRFILIRCSPQIYTWEDSEHEDAEQAAPSDGDKPSN